MEDYSDNIATDTFEPVGDNATGPLEMETGFLSGLSEEHRSFAAENGWSDAASVFAGFKALQGELMGSVQVPGSEASDQERSEFYSEISKSWTPKEGYRFSMPENLPESFPYDQAFAQVAGGWFEEAGLHPEAAQKLHDRWVGKMAEQFTAHEAAATEAYRKPQAVWLELEDQEAKSAAWAPKLCVYHRHAQQGRPVRAVKFIASDGTNTVESTVSALTTSQYSASGLYANYFQPGWNLSSLTDGEFITVDAVIYPWVGDAFQLTVDGAAYPSPNISTLRAICNIGDTMYHKVYAYVDGTGVGSPAANTDEATAKANPFASFAAAATAAKAVNLAENGWNNLSGVDLVLSSGTTYSDRLSGMGGALDKLPCTMRGEDATAVLTDGTSSASGSTIPPILHVRDINIRKERNFIMFRGDNTGNGYLAFENCACSFANGEGSYEALTYQYGRGAVINCTGPYIGLCGQFGTTQGGMLFAGNAFGGNQPYNMVACNAAQIATNNHQLGQADGSLFAWNTVSRSGNNGNAIQFQGDEYGDQGVAVIGNVVEIHTLVGSQTAFLVFGDGDTTTVKNLCESMNTIVGQRTNFLYNDIGTVSIPKDGVSKLSYHWQFNQKGDYDIDQPLVGNWANRHGVDTKVTGIRDSAGNDNYSYQSWLGEQLGDEKSANTEGPVGHVFDPFQAVNPDWVNDQSSSVSGSGGGDYTPGASNTLPTIPAGQTEFAVDQKGRAIPLDGTAVVGALQQVV